MIVEATLAVKFGLTVDDSIDTVHPIPDVQRDVRARLSGLPPDTSTMSWCAE